MLTIKKSLFLLMVCFALGSNAFGQATPSPFTSFGIGEMYGSSLIHNQGMGGVGYSHPQYWFLNNQNPALLVHTYRTVFQAGILLEQRSIQNDTASERQRGANMNYMAMAFPIRLKERIGKWGMSVGLMPYSQVHYKVIDPNAPILNSTATITETEQGSGGISDFYWSNGVRLHENFSIGLKASYLFGSLVKNYTNQLNQSLQPMVYVVPVEDKTYIKDFSFSGGFSFSKDSLSKKNLQFSLGGVYGIGTNLRAKWTNKLQRRDQIGNILENIQVDSIQGNLHIPSSIGLGMSLAKSAKWAFGVDYSYQNWSNYKNVDQGNDGLAPSSRIGFGGELTPDLFDVDKYLNRITYRMGVSYEKYPYLANNNKVKDFGINFGLSLPAGRSSVDFAFKVGKRGLKSETIFEESYFKVYFGITFNDENWFIKRKFD